MREPEQLRLVREESARLPGAGMLLAPEQGQLMAMLVRMIGVRRYLEIGTYTGYSALAVALAMPRDGEIIACELDPVVADIARTHWTRAGVAERMDLRIGPAVATLDALATTPGEPLFDMAFIDADKENIRAYYERCLDLVRVGGLVLVDNTLWSGAVCDPMHNDPETEAIRAFNLFVHGDARVEMVLLPIGDGLTIARKVS
jgi:caffeoyl-CoA O-methyltransferase